MRARGTADDRTAFDREDGVEARVGKIRRDPVMWAGAVEHMICLEEGFIAGCCHRHAEGQGSYPASWLCLREMNCLAVSTATAASRQ